MKIAVISTPVFACPPPGYSGLEQIAWQLADGLGLRGHQVALVAPEGSTCPHATVIPCGPAGRWDEHQAYQHYWKYLPEFDVVVDMSWQKWSYLLKGEGVLPAPVLGVLHAPVDTMYKVLPPNVARPSFVCISRDQAAHFEALFSRPAKVAYNGVDPDFYRPLHVPKSGRFLFLARFSTIKGADLAIEACQRAGVGLDLVGDTTITNEPQFLAKCRSMADGTQIRIAGGVARGEAVWWYSQATALLHPNQRFREPFGLAPVEALMCGCPVVSWNYGAMRETIPPQDGCRLVWDLNEMIQQIQTLRDNPPATTESALATTERLRQWAVDRYSVDKMVEGYEALCSEAIKTGGW